MHATHCAELCAPPSGHTNTCMVPFPGFKDNSATFAAKGYKIYGLSADQPDVQAGWKKEHNLNYTLLCDPSKQASVRARKPTRSLGGSCGLQIDASVYV